MDISILERNARLGVYDLDVGLLSNNGHLTTLAPNADEMREKLRKQLREDCILAAISAGCTRRGSKQIFQVAYENANKLSNREVAMVMIGLIKRVSS